MRLARALFFGFVATTFVTCPVRAGGPTAPEEWVGVWEITQTTEDCGGGNEQVTKSVDTICPDDIIFDTDPDGESGTECTGTVDGNSFDLMCTSVTEIFDCTITIAIDMEGERVGDTYTMMGTIVTTVEGSGEFCGKLEETCQAISVVATRVDSDPEECVDVPTESATWTEIKSRYR